MTEEQENKEANEENSAKDQQWTCPLGSAAKAMGCDPRAARRFCLHMGKAGLEVLKAFESLLQAAAGEEAPPAKKATKIKID